MLKYRLRKIPRKKFIVWTTMILMFFISLGSIVDFYAAGNPFPNAGSGSVVGDTVIINDLVDDWNYYMGLNYTEIINKTNIPGINADHTASVNTNKYNADSLVAVQINYNGEDINYPELVGYVSSSANENQSKFTYYKYYPIVNNKVEIELIDNPYYARPTGKGFNGWVCDNTATTNSIPCSSMTFSYDDDYYVRKVTVNAPAADANGDKKLVINLKATWAKADVKTMANGISAANAKILIDGFSKKTMKQFQRTPIYEAQPVYVNEYQYLEGNTYYEYTKIARNSSMSKCENKNKNTNSAGNCNKSGGCDCYFTTEDPVGVEGKTYYLYDRTTSGVDYYRQAVDTDFNVVATDEVSHYVDVLVGYDYGFENGDLLVGYYHKVTGYNNTNKDLYYDVNGVSCSVTTCGATAYKLVQYNDPDTVKYWSTTTNEAGELIVNNDYTSYYTLVTRDTNFLELANGTFAYSLFANKTVPFTITGSHDDSKTTTNVILNLSSNLDIQEDMGIENLKLSGPTYAYNSSNVTGQMINANFQNLKLGRNIHRNGTRLNANSVIAGGLREYDTVHKYYGKTIIETGVYKNARALGASTSFTNERVILQIGSDYDRAKGDNSKLDIVFNISSSVAGNHNSSTINPVSQIIVKSGSLGSEMLNIATNGHSRDDKYYMYGMYVGSHSAGTSSGLRTAKIEGGQIFSINGGPCVGNSNSIGNTVGIYVTGGSIQNVVGGAGVSATYGNRIVSITGGTIANAVAGGSNSFYGSSSPGPMYGSTLVYVGGNSVIGGTLIYKDNTATKTLYGVEEVGSVFGAGLGKSGDTTRGVVGNSHVIIDKGATINGSVYGGGNFGATGTKTTSDTYSLVDLYGGNIKGNFYGASNKNGAGHTSYFHQLIVNAYDVDMTKSFYGGSNNNGTVTGNVTLNLYNVNINANNTGLYGGGKGKDTKITRDVIINVIPENDSDITINELYGGSELGSVNTSGTKYSTKIEINGGNIGTVYGGGKGSATISPNTDGNITINMNTGNVNNIFGGCNIRGIIDTLSVINVKGGIVDNVYGGSDGSQNASNVSAGTVGAVNTNVNVTGGKIKTAVYGGGKKARTTGIATVKISGGDFLQLGYDGYIVPGSTPAEVFGGGEAAAVQQSRVEILDGALLYNVYGGSNISGIVNTANVYNNAGTIVCNSYGGGKIAESGTTNNYLNGTNYSYVLKEGEDAYTTLCGNAFGGGKNAAVANANVMLNGSTLLNVYGGSNEGGIVTKSNVLIKDGTIQNAFGGNNQGGYTVNTVVEVDTNSNKVETPNPVGLTVDNVFGGSNGSNASVSGTTTTNVRSGVVKFDVFGGGNQAKVVGGTYVNMYGGTVTNLYGGGNRSFIGDAEVNSTGVLLNGISLGTTYVNVVNGIIKENVYGSGNASFVYGDTKVKIGDTALRYLNINDNKKRTITINGSVFAGSETNSDESTVYQDDYEGVTGDRNGNGGTGLIEIDASTYIDLGKTTIIIDGSIYGSGNNSKVVNGSDIHIKKYGTKDNPSVSTSIQRASDVYITDSHIELNGTIDRADPNSYRYSLIRLDSLNLLGSSATNGTYMYLRQGTSFLRELKSGYMSATGVFSPQKVTKNNGTLTVSVSDNRIYMLANKVLSISDSEAPLYDSSTTKAGPITGMTFLGMYTRESGKDYVRGIYDYSYRNDSIYYERYTGAISKSAYTFAYGLNLTNYTMKQQVENHGFYTNVVVNASESPDESDDGKKLKYEYVGVTPDNETTLYYKWVIGVEPVEIIVDLIADKYSESGAVNALISLDELKEYVTNANGETVKQDWRDAVMTIQSVDTTSFGATDADATRAFDGVLVDKSEIPTINTDDQNGDGVVDANNYFALSMGTTSAGWVNNYKTNFYDNDYLIKDNSFCNTNTGNCTGDQIYLYDSTGMQRNLSFWLYHSKNLDFSYIDKSMDENNMLISMNQVYIDAEFFNPHGDPTSAESTQLVRITVNISLSDGELDKYGGVIAPGKKYEVFQGRPATIASNGSFSTYQSLSLDLTKPIAGSATGERWSVDKLYHPAKIVQVIDAYNQTRPVQWSESYRYLASSYALPVGTVITMLDLKNEQQYYYEVTESNYSAKAADVAQNNMCKYYLEDFLRMGSTTSSKKFTDDMKGERSTLFYYKDLYSKLAIEEFIFNVDFSGANVQVQNPNGDQHYFFLELARLEDGAEKVIVSTKGTPREEMVYTIKPQVSSVISTEGGYLLDNGDVSPSTTIYVGESTNLKLDTELLQMDNNNQLLYGVSDTVFDEYKLGAKITVKKARLDENGNVVLDSNGKVVYDDMTNDLFGTVMRINGQSYYPQTDGSTRIELAGRVSEITSNINIDFSNSSLPYGDYILVVETFVSYDGLYYGNYEPTYNEFPFELLNNQYGLDVKTKETYMVTHDVNTGEDSTGSREIHYIVDVINGLSNPNLKISISRREYSPTNMYGTSYSLIPVTNLVESIRMGDDETNVLSAENACFSANQADECYIYTIGNITNSSLHKTYDIYMTLKNGPSQGDLGDNKPYARWKSGTYRVNYLLYDGDVEVGSYYEYLIIRSLGVDEIIVEGSGD